VRVEGWEQRFALELERALATPYAIGEHDCFQFACRVVTALTGRTISEEFTRCYRTADEARAAIAAQGGAVRGMGRVFGGRLIRPANAQRGDLLLYEDTTGEAHIGVCVGRDVAVLGAAGLEFIALDACLAAWRIE